MTLLEAIEDLKSAAESAYDTLGPAAGDMVIKDALADGVLFVAAAIRQGIDQDKKVCPWCAE